MYDISMPRLPKNSISSHVAGSVNNANAMTMASRPFIKSPIASSSIIESGAEFTTLIPIYNVPPCDRSSAHNGTYSRGQRWSTIDLSELGEGAGW